MPPPSPLAIATASVRRLLKEEASYHKELADQQAKIKQLEDRARNAPAGGDENDEYMLKQEVRPPNEQTLQLSLWEGGLVNLGGTWLTLVAI